MIIKQEEIDIAAISYYHNTSDVRLSDGFKAGVEFAESKFEEIAIEWVNYANDNYLVDDLSFTELYQQFIKERHEKQDKRISSKA